MQGNASASTASASKSSIGSPRFDEEIRAFLQERLRILTGVLSMILGILSALFVLTMAGERESVPRAAVEFATELPNAILFFLFVLASGLYAVLRARAVAARSLALVDGALLEALIGVCLFIYALRSALLECSAAGEWTEDDARAWWHTFTFARRHPSEPVDSEISASSAETRIRPDASENA